MATAKKSRKEGSDNNKKNFWRSFGRFFLCLMFIGIIAGCILTSVVAVYVFEYVEGETDVDLRNLELNYTSIIYATDKETGEPYELQRLSNSGQNRIWAGYDEIPEQLIDATIAAEDERFLEHHGVDWKRTIAVTADYLLSKTIGIGGNAGGGSTIEQQLIKNVKSHTDRSPAVKVQEIFGAIRLDKAYSKEEIMEAYLNTVHFGHGTNGVRAAANLYFDKDISELDLLESSSIIAITQNPTKYDLFTEDGMENNAKRRSYILGNLLEHNKISQSEYDEIINEDPVVAEVSTKEEDSTQSWFIDHVLETVTTDLMEQEGISRQEASNRIIYGGYSIYTTLDTQVQDYLEAKYQDPATFPALFHQDYPTNRTTVSSPQDATYPETACVIMDPFGKILGMMGGNEKDRDRAFNRATQALRQPGSTIKPISAYLQAFDMDLINWSSIYYDKPVKNIKDDITGEDRPWPKNYNLVYDDGPMTVQYALMVSKNTVPAQIIDTIGPQVAYDFLKNQLGLYNLKEGYDNYSEAAMALGGLTQGVTLLEMVGAYQIFANGGMFVEPYCYTEVLDADGEVVLSNRVNPTRVVASDTITVLNKLLQTVTKPGGSGVSANLGAMPLIGKTGTSSDNKDLLFIGATPYYVAGVWMGYDEPDRMDYVYYPPPIMWKNLFADLHKNLPIKNFPESTDVEAHTYCLDSGELATDECPRTAVGWYKKTNLPPVCSIHGDGEPLGEGRDSDNRDSESEEEPDKDEGFSFPWRGLFD